MSSIPRKRLKTRQGYKFCNYCKQEKPATFDYFHHSSNAGPLQLTHVCKACWKDYVTGLEQKRAATYEGAIRRCTKCGKEFPATPEFFYRAGAALRHDCKQCAYQRGKRYNKEHKEEKQTKRKIYEELHRERIRDRFREYCHTHSEQYRIHDDKKRMRRLQVPGSHTAKDILAQYERQKGKCYWCGKKVHKGKNGYHRDHIVPLARGGSNNPDNLVIACHSCNESKRDKLPHEWHQGGRLL